MVHRNDTFAEGSVSCSIVISHRSHLVIFVHFLNIRHKPEICSRTTNLNKGVYLVYPNELVHTLFYIYLPY